MPKVSVIIPTYNRAEIVTEAIDSVLQQTYNNIEIIVVDDGSSDHTGEVLTARYGNKIIYLPQQHKGVPARNAGISISSGNYIAFLDSDDLWMPDKLEKQVNLLETLPEKVGMIFCGVYVQEISGSIVSTFYHPYMHKGNILKNLVLSEGMASPSRVLIRKMCIERVGLFNESLRRSSDTELWMRIARYFEADYIEEALVIKRHLDNNMMKDPGCLDDVAEVYKLIFEDPDCPDEIRQLKKKAYARRFLNYMWIYHRSGMTAKKWNCFLRALLHDMRSIRYVHLKMLVQMPGR